MLSVHLLRMKKYKTAETKKLKNLIVIILKNLIKACARVCVRNCRAKSPVSQSKNTMCIACKSNEKKLSFTHLFSTSRGDKSNFENRICCDDQEQINRPRATTKQPTTSIPLLNPREFCASNRIIKWFPRFPVASSFLFRWPTSCIKVFFVFSCTLHFFHAARCYFFCSRDNTHNMELGKKFTF